MNHKIVPAGKIDSPINDIMNKHVIDFEQSFLFAHFVEYIFEFAFADGMKIKGILDTQAIQIDQIKTTGNFPIGVFTRYND